MKAVTHKMKAITMIKQSLKTLYNDKMKTNPFSNEAKALLKRRRQSFVRIQLSLRDDCSLVPRSETPTVFDVHENLSNDILSRRHDCLRDHDEGR